ncbi:MAG TPA: hypothetical protein VFE37_25535 [Chloroflexota bacterium]|nr:hypothetical protein [Chloroflexota bacterium]
MARFSIVSQEEARRAVLPPRQATQAQYQEYVRGLTPDSAGRLELGPGDRSITERARLKAAAKALGMNLEIRRRGDTIVFWPSSEPPKPRGQASTRGRGRSKAR